jgi:hypothetical protein
VALAERVKSAGTEDAQVRKAFEIVYQREPSAEELAASVELLHDTTAPTVKAEASIRTVEFNAKPDSESKVESKMDVAAAAPATPPKAKPVETPLEALCWALLSSNEFLFLN